MKRYYSPSQLELYMTNPRMYKHRYIDGKLPPPSEHLLFGSLIHEIFERHLTHGDIQTKVEYFEDKFAKAFKKASLSQSALHKGIAGFISPIIEELCKCDRHYLHCEKFFSFNVNGREVKNRIDRIILHKTGNIFEEDTLSIEDLKTTKKLSDYTPSIAFSTFQLRCYAYAAQTNLNIPVKVVRYRLITKSDEPKMRVITVKLEKGWEKSLLEDIEMLIKGIENNIFPRQYHNPWLDYYDFFEEDWGNLSVKHAVSYYEDL